MFFFNHGDGVAGGVGSETNYLTANEDGAWVGLERFPHPTDSQYSWVSRLAEMFNAKTKNFCRHDSCLESVIQSVIDSADMFPSEQKFHFIGMPTWTKRIFPIYGSWGNTKYYQWSPHYEFWGEECSMDGTDFNREKGKKIIIDALSTGGVKPKDPTFEDHNDQRFYQFSYQTTNFEFQPGLFHPDNDQHIESIEKWLDQCEDFYKEQCEIIQKETGQSRFGHLEKHFKNLYQTIIDHPEDKFLFYGTEDMLTQNVIELLFKNWEVKIDEPKNTYWFWGSCMNNYFEGMKIPPRWNGYYSKEQHFEFMRHMNKKLTELDKML